MIDPICGCPITRSDIVAELALIQKQVACVEEMAYLVQRKLVARAAKLRRELAKLEAGQMVPHG